MTTIPVQSKRRPTILHVVEALGGGVLVALKDYIDSTCGDFDHVVLAKKRTAHDTGTTINAQVLDLGSISNLPRAARRLRETFNALQPDLVHLHSSWAGALGRASQIPVQKIAYTPHCYAFERTDVSRAARGAYYSVEKVLAARASTIIACSPREAELARSLNSEANVTYVPNIARQTDVMPVGRQSDSGPLIVGTGRVSPQKDPVWFASFADCLKALHPSARFMWLGGGDAAGVEVLENAGVEVTGWIPRAELLTIMSRADCYVHSAAWEGAPLSVVEAASFGLPIFARRILALESLGLGNLFSEPRQLADAVSQHLQDGTMPEAGLDSLELAARHSPEEQKMRLNAAYRAAISERASAETRVYS